MEYNTIRSKLLMPEYGRNVQKMVEYLLTIDDKDRCLRNAEAVIELMATLTPHLKTMEDYQHKLWDHLYQMTDFKLDVNGPYPKPTPEAVFKKPEPLPYPQGEIRNRHLGKNLDGLIKKALEEKDDEKRRSLTQLIGYYMKLAYTNWHREPVHDDMIRNELSVLSDGKLQYEPGGYRVYFDTRTNYKQQHQRTNQRGFKGGGRDQRGGGGYNNGGGYNKNRKFKKK
jgi:hypothetical protein